MKKLFTDFTAPTTSLLEYQHVYMVGIKGVAMTALARMLCQAGVTVSGTDVAEDFVTDEQLAALPVSVDTGFDPAQLPVDVDCVVYTAAHQGEHNPLVQAAQQRGIVTFSHAEALASLVNTKKLIAVCGVGGKSTTSAMIAWMLEKTGQQPSYAVGVGSIPGLEGTGNWAAGEWCVVEADEYVTNPSAAQQGEPITPRFSYLKPQIIICTSVVYDHPDVYQDAQHTKATYLEFFKQLPTGGTLIYTAESSLLAEIVIELKELRPDILLRSYGRQAGEVRWSITASSPARTAATLKLNSHESYTFELSVPGIHNVDNACAAALAVHQATGQLEDGLDTLKQFKSTQRRFENRGIINGVQYFDDYAHHPREIAAVLNTVADWKVAGRVIIVFQPHTYSRTKQLFDEFVQVLATAPELVLLDIFASAREADDPSISSDILLAAVQSANSSLLATNVHSIAGLAQYCTEQTQPGDVVITLGAGDLYQVYEQLT